MSARAWQALRADRRALAGAVVVAAAVAAALLGPALLGPAPVGLDDVVARRFVAPLDAEILACYPRRGGLMHLCGAHTQHLPAWRDMPELRAVQLNDRAAEDFPLYFAGLREDQIIYLNPTVTMPPARALAISGGRRLVLVAEA